MRRASTGTTSRSTPRSSSPRFPAPRPSSTSTTATCIGSCRRRACTSMRCSEPVQVYLDPARLYAFDRGGRARSGTRPRHRAGAEEAAMARIDFEAVAHSYVGPSARAAGLRAEAAAVRLRGRRRLCAAGAVGLRQDHPAQHHLGLAGHPSEGRVLFDRRDVTRLPPAQRNIAQVFQFPVIYDTMTVGENLAFPLAQSRRGRRPASRPGSPRSRPCSTSSR